MMKRIALGILAAGFSLSGASATTVTIQSTDSPWNYATTFGSEVAGSMSTTPVITAITPGAGKTLTFSSVTGTVSLTPGYTYGPDGGVSCPPGACPLTVSAAAGLSGIVSGHSAFLAGVFLNGDESAAGHVTPATLSFSDFSFASLAPQDDQVFFIGDGLTGAGAQQIFTVPDDATGLVLAIADANGYSGPPGAYFDNSGFFVATFAISGPAAGGVPEAATWAMMVAGLGLAGIAMRRRRGVTAASYTRA